MTPSDSCFSSTTGTSCDTASTQLTHGSIGDELAQRMIERVPAEIAKAAWEERTQSPEDYGDTLRDLDVPLLFAKHEGCLGTTEEGFEDAVASFPEARTLSVPEAPSVSSEFAAAVRSFIQLAARRAIVSDLAYGYEGALRWGAVPDLELLCSTLRAASLQCGRKPRSFQAL